ncbi:hypothetical protein B0H14DRAFT_2655023 [Mycena olivaceomarginata]|nr:hypothetical protein B0H14DRAFT_2655023 [Mycena olivaceomarginata]
MPGISEAQSLQASTSWPSPEAQCKDLEGRKIILLDQQRDLGDNHPETLEAMEKFAWLHYELGDFKSERDLQVTVLEKYQILQAEDDPHTLQVMDYLGSVHRVLGQDKEAQELEMAAVESIPNFWEKIIQALCGPCTLWQISTIDSASSQRAEDQYHIVVEKSIRILGENHPSTLQAIRGLGMMYLASGELKKTEALLTVVFDKQKKILGKEHPDTIFTMDHLAMLQRSWQLQLYRSIKRFAVKIILKPCG